MKWTERATFLVENLNLPAASGVETARWEHFQLSHLMDNSRFRHEVKSRQIAWSFTAAAEAMALAILRTEGTSPDSLFLSINLEEAKEKIRYAKAVYENLEIKGLPELVRDNELALELSNGSRLQSMPARPPRGKAKFNVYLDEFAHVQYDREIYTAALPVISKGGWLRMASSPLGASGVFWEVGEQELRSYSGYTRKVTPWWHVHAFCNNVREAVKLAPNMASEERVMVFGREPIRAIYENMPLEDFQQEYECAYVDESTAWITWEEIKNNQQMDLKCKIAKAEGKDISRVLHALDELALWAFENDIENIFGVGVDVGRTRDATEIMITSETSTHQFPLRGMFTLHNVPFEEQELVLQAVMRRLNVRKMNIDQNGIGRNLAEKMVASWPTKCEGIDFTNETKHEMAADTKMLFQQRRVPIPIDRDLAYQIHSIKKMISASKKNVFDTDRNEKHHADKFWGLALSYRAINRGLRIISGIMGYSDDVRALPN